MSTSKEKKNRLVISAGIVAGATTISRILGLIREQTMAYFFGASMATDAFIAAFRIPNLLRDLFAEGALSSAFVPVFKEKLVKEDKQAAFELAQTFVTLLLVVVGGIVLLGIIATPVIVFIMANGFTVDPDKFELTVSLTRLMFAYLLLVSLSALVMGMLNSFGKFGIPAISPALFNIGIIGGIFLLRQFFDIPVYALAVGVLIGGLGQLFVQLPLLFKMGFRFRFRFDFLDKSVKAVMKLFTPMVAGLSAGRVNILVSTLLASFLIEGSISYLSYSYRLMHFPLGVFAVALGTVALPNASEQVAKNDFEGLRETFERGLNINMLLVIPSAVVLAFAGRDIVRVIYGYGAFDLTAIENTSRALLHYSYGLVGFAAVRVTVPIYYAFKDSIIPMKVSFVTVFINLVLYYPLISLFDFAGLASATSIAGLINFALLLYFLPRHGLKVKYGRIFLNIIRIGIASLLALFIAGLLPYQSLTENLGHFSPLLNLILLLLSGAFFYLIFCYIFRIREMAFLLSIFVKKNKNR